MITCLHHRAPGGGQDRVLLVMLPGVGIEASEFASRGLVAAVRERGLVVDIVAADIELDLYLDGRIAASLHDAIIKPALAQGYSRIWFLGISLGGMGALLYASAYGAHVEGLVLLAPFLGTQGTVAEIAAAGGLASWSTSNSAATATESRILVWLQDFVARRPARPQLYLGYGTADRFALGHRMLAERLPRNYVVTEEGGHDWDTWLTLWHRLLDASPFTAKSGGDCGNWTRGRPGEYDDVNSEGSDSHDHRP